MKRHTKLCITNEKENHRWGNPTLFSHSKEAFFFFLSLPRVEVPEPRTSCRQPATGSERCSRNVQKRKKTQRNVLPKRETAKNFLSSEKKSCMPALQMGELRRQLGLISAFSQGHWGAQQPSPDSPSRLRPPHTPRRHGTARTGRALTRKSHQALGGRTPFQRPPSSSRGGVPAVRPSVLAVRGPPPAQKDLGRGPRAVGPAALGGHSPSLSALTSRDMPFSRST